MGKTTSRLLATGATALVLSLAPVASAVACWFDQNHNSIVRDGVVAGYAQFSEVGSGQFQVQVKLHNTQSEGVYAQQRCELDELETYLASGTGSIR